MTTNKVHDPKNTECPRNLYPRAHTDIPDCKMCPCTCEKQQQALQEQERQQLEDDRNAGVVGLPPQEPTPTSEEKHTPYLAVVENGVRRVLIEGGEDVSGGGSGCPPDCPDRQPSDGKARVLIHGGGAGRVPTSVTGHTCTEKCRRLGASDISVCCFCGCGMPVDDKHYACSHGQPCEEHTSVTGDECVFCSMSFPDTEVLNIEPLNPVTKGHRIFIPKDHVRDFSENADVTIKTMYAAQQYAKEVGGDFNIITSAGKSATQSVFHLHVHFVPRTENDGLGLPWTKQREIDQALLAQRTHIKQALLGRATRMRKKEPADIYDGEDLFPKKYNNALDDIINIINKELT